MVVHVRRQTKAGRPCNVCEHTKRRDIEAAVLAGEPIAHIAERFLGVSKFSLHRHVDFHMSFNNRTGPRGRGFDTDNDSDAQRDKRRERASNQNNEIAALAVVKQTAYSEGLNPLFLRDIDEDRSKSILDLLWETQTLLRWGMEEAKRKHATVALAQVGAQRIRVLEVLAKMYQDLLNPADDATKTRDEDWAAFRQLVRESLTEYPEARAALGDAILRVVREQRARAAMHDDDA